MRIINAEHTNIHSGTVDRGPLAHGSGTLQHMQPLTDRRERDPADGERALWRAVLKQAMDDARALPTIAHKLMHNNETSIHETQAARDDVVAWVRAQGEDVNGFLGVCATCGVDPVRVGRALLDAAAKAEARETDILLAYQRELERKGMTHYTLGTKSRAARRCRVVESADCGSGSVVVEYEDGTQELLNALRLRRVA